MNSNLWSQTLRKKYTRRKIQVSNMKLKNAQWDRHPVENILQVVIL